MIWLMRASEGWEWLEAASTSLSSSGLNPCSSRSGLRPMSRRIAPAAVFSARMNGKKT